MLFFRDRLYKFRFICFRIWLYSSCLIIKTTSIDKILCYCSI
nr:MAG TPA: hypothetical protein [Crassvirales sp.]